MYTESEITRRRIGLQFFAEPDKGGSAVEGGSGGQDAGGQGGASSGGQGGNPTAEKTFTQEQVSTMMANEKRTARSALLKELGYEVKEGAKLADVIATVKGILDQGKTQQQLDQEARTKAEEDKTAAETRATALQAQVDVMKAGVKPDYVEDVITMLLPKVTEEKPLSKLLEEYKTKYPAWFGEGSSSSGTGSPTNPPRGKGGETEGMGKRLAQTGKAQAKSTYFRN